MIKKRYVNKTISSSKFKDENNSNNRKLKIKIFYNYPVYMKLFHKINYPKLNK